MCKSRVWQLKLTQFTQYLIYCRDLTAFKAFPSSFYPDLLVGINAIAPSNNQQAQVDARYAQNDLYSQRIVVFEDPQLAYSGSLAKAFKADSSRVVDTETYTTGLANTIVQAWQRAKEYNPDLLFFTGYAGDVSTLLTQLPPCPPSPQLCLQVLGGDALYVLGNYTNEVRPNLHRLRFTAFAYPDMWQIANLGTDESPFFTEYPQDFDNKQRHASPYGNSRPDADTILGYDATLTLLTGYTNALTFTRVPTGSDIQRGLKQITRDHALQGASGRIAFSPDNGADDTKVIVILFVNGKNEVQEMGISGQLLA